MRVCVVTYDFFIRLSGSEREMSDHCGLQGCAAYLCDRNLIYFLKKTHKKKTEIIRVLLDRVATRRRYKE